MRSRREKGTAKPWSPLGRPHSRAADTQQGGCTCIVCIVGSEDSLSRWVDEECRDRNILYRLMTHGGGRHDTRRVEPRCIDMVHWPKSGIRNWRLVAMAARRRSSVLIVTSHVRRSWTLMTEECSWCFGDGLGTEERELTVVLVVRDTRWSYKGVVTGSQVATRCWECRGEGLTRDS